MPFLRRNCYEAILRTGVQILYFLNITKVDLLLNCDALVAVSYVTFNTYFVDFMVL